MRFTKQILGLLTLILCWSCGNNTSDEYKNPVFLEGKWIMVNNGQTDKIFVEEWELENDSSFIGKGYIENRSTGDRFNSENLWLTHKNNSWVYLAEPSGADKTAFPATRIDESVLRFENLEHDFPQFIQYERISQDSLLVSIGDTSNSKNWKMIRSL